MKKLLSFLAVAGLASSALTGCVDDNSTVVAKGLIGSSSCSATSEDQSYLYSMECDPNAKMSSGAEPSLALALHIMNYLTGATPWSSSSSGSGTTFVSQQPNAGSIFIDKIHIKCSSVDGESSKCDGRDEKTISLNSNVVAGGGLCSVFHLNAADFTWGDSVVLDIYADYHDSSLIKGSTSHTTFTFNFVTMPSKDVEYAYTCTTEREEPAEESENSGTGSEEQQEDEKK